MKKMRLLFAGALLLSVCGCASEKTAVTFYEANTKDVIYLNKAEIKNAPPSAMYAEGSTAQPVDPAESVIYARSVIWKEAPQYVFGKWIGKSPDDAALKDRFVLINFWASWCPPSRCSLPLMNHFAEKFTEDLTVINISHEEPDVIRDFLKDYPRYQSYFSCDTDSTMRNHLNVFGIPHSILIEPDGHIVIWEGFPLSLNRPLTDEALAKFIKNRNDSIKKVKP